MASISTDEKTGRRRILFVGIDGKRHAIYLGKMSMKAAATVKSKVETIVAAQTNGVPVDQEAADWLFGKLDHKLQRKLARVGLVPTPARPEQHTLAAFIDGLIAERTDVKVSTATVYGHTRRNLVTFFGASKPLSAVTPADADDFRRHLGRPTTEKGEGLAVNTVNRRCGIAKQFFRVAIRKKLIHENPFGDMKGITVRGNRSRDFFVTREMAQRVLDACPDAQWRLLFALSRFGGLRCPSEHLGLLWGDVDWAANRFTVHSPKTEHHEGRESRVIPIFPELSQYLDEVFQQAAEGTDHVITRYRDRNSNLRTQLERIIRKAGLTPWPKLFQNLRSTRQTELAERFEPHVVCAWIGNSQAVAREHYLQVTDEHFEKATRKTTQQEAAMCSRDQQHESAKVENPEKPAISRGIVIEPMGGTGLEPVTSTV